MAEAAPREVDMIKIAFDAEHATVILEFVGNVDAAQAKQYFIDLEKTLPKDAKTLRLLIDISAVDTVDLEAKDELEKGMDLLNARGVSEIFRAAPDPDLDIGFNVMATTHFSKHVRVHTLRSRQDAQARLYEACSPPLGS
jgi:anti-anti-sigma regulatory factor